MDDPVAARDRRGRMKKFLVTAAVVVVVPTLEPLLAAWFMAVWEAVGVSELIGKAQALQIEAKCKHLVEASQTIKREDEWRATAASLERHIRESR
jgi:hypothetical protein